MRTKPAERMGFLRTLPLFKDLSDSVLYLLATESRYRVFQRGETLVHQGEPGATCYLIMKGRVRVYVITEDGRELAVRIMGVGELFGEMALLDEQPRSANVEAMESTHTLEVSQELLLRCLRCSPQFSLRLLQAMSVRLRSTTEDVEGLASLPVPERLLRQLARLAERLGRPVPGGVQIMLPLTQQQLASMVGTSRESVNRALARLRRENRVSLEEGWIILLETRSK